MISLGRQSGDASTSGSVIPSGWWRYGGAAAAAATITGSACSMTGLAFPLALQVSLLPATWRKALLDVVATPNIVSVVLIQVAVFVYWRCLVAREGGETGAGAAKRARLHLKPQPLILEMSSLFALLFLVFKAAIGRQASDLDVASVSSSVWFLWIALRSQFGKSPPLFPAIEGRTRFFRVKSRLGFALKDTLRTVVLAAVASVGLKILSALVTFFFKVEAGATATGSLLNFKPLVHPTTLYLCWLIYSSFHATEVVATERFRYCRTVNNGGNKMAVLGMDSLIRFMTKTQGKGLVTYAIDRELAFLDACLQAEKSKYWRNALFTYNKGDYWYQLTGIIHEELTKLEQKLIQASMERPDPKKSKKPVTRSRLARDANQQRAFLTARNIHSIASSVRDSQLVFTWSVRTVAALARACAKEDLLGVSQRHSKRPSLQDVLVTSVSLYLLFTSLEVQLAQASGKQSGMVPDFHKMVHRILGVNVLDGDMETIYTNVWAMNDSLKLSIYSIVKAFTCDLFSLQMENILDTLSKASENASLKYDPFCEKLPLFYPLWMDESQLGHGTPSQHAHVLNQILLNNL